RLLVAEALALRCLARSGARWRGIGRRAGRRRVPREARRDRDVGSADGRGRRLLCPVLPLHRPAYRLRAGGVGGGPARADRRGPGNAVRPAARGGRAAGARRGDAQPPRRRARREPRRVRHRARRHGDVPAARRRGPLLTAGRVMLEARSISVRFGGVQALSDVSLAVGTGGITALIGPNGAGKSTLFGVVSGFIAADSGSVHFASEDVTGLPPHLLCRLGLARTFQIVRPFAAQTVRENIAVGAHLSRASRHDALAHAEVIAAQVGLASQLDKIAANLTVAARKRLELARALATGPKLLLLDE